jgi:hypothetical protein
LLLVEPPSLTVCILEEGEREQKEIEQVRRRSRRSGR